MKQLSGFQASVAATVLATQLVACTTWRVVEPAPLAFDPPRPAQHMRVTLADSSRREWSYAVMAGGRIGPRPDAALGVPLADVRRVEVGRFSWSKTTVLMVVIVGATVGLVNMRMAGPGGCCGINFPGPW